MSDAATTPPKMAPSIAASAAVPRRRRVRELVLAAAKARAQQALTLGDSETPLFAPYSPSPNRVIDAVWDFLATIKHPPIAPHELLVDLGCGDGRWLISGVQRHQCSALGIEIDEALVATAQTHVQQLGLTHRIRVQQDDIMRVDISDAKIVIVYAFAESLHGIRAHLETQLGDNASVLSIGVRRSSHSIPKPSHTNSSKNSLCCVVPSPRLETEMVRQS